MNCINECVPLRTFRDGLEKGDLKHKFDAEESIDVLVRLAENSEKSTGWLPSPAVLEETILFEKGYVDLLFDVCETRGIAGIGVLGAVLRAANTQDCGTCPFSGLTLPELANGQLVEPTDGRS